MTQGTCAERVEETMRSTMEDLRILWDLYREGDEEGDPDLGSLWEYGLEFSYEEPARGERSGYCRWLFSTGGPQTELRFYWRPGRYGPICTGAEFWLLDWFDGAGVDLHGEDFALASELFDWFAETQGDQEEWDQWVREQCDDF